MRGGMRGHDTIKNREEVVVGALERDTVLHGTAVSDKNDSRDRYCSVHCCAGAFQSAFLHKLDRLWSTISACNGAPGLELAEGSSLRSCGRGNHLAGKGCRACAGLDRLTTAEFIRRSQEVHGAKYDYSKSEYINQKTRVRIICPIHGEFLQLPFEHYHAGSGCNRCASEERGLTPHTELVRMAYSDFARLVKPAVVEF